MNAQVRASENSVISIVVGPSKKVAKEKNAGVKGTCAHAHKCFGDNIYDFKKYLAFCGGAPHWEKI